MSLPQYYKLLGLNNKNPSEDELKKAYKKAALKYHPDRNINNENNEQTEIDFKNLGEAYKALLNRYTKK